MNKINSGLGSNINKLIYYYFFSHLENEAGTVFYVSDVQLERILSDLDHEHQIASIGRKEAMKLAFILNKDSPYKAMFDQVQ